MSLCSVSIHSFVPHIFMLRTARAQTQTCTRKQKSGVCIFFFFFPQSFVKNVYICRPAKRNGEKLLLLRGEQNSCRLALKTLKSFTDATLPLEQLIGVKLGYKLLICFQGRKSDNEFEMICH